MLPADRAALVTGASRGLGAVIARHLAGAGWAVAVGYRFDAASAERVVAEIVASGGRARAYGGDITDEAQQSAKSSRKRRPTSARCSVSSRMRPGRNR